MLRERPSEYEQDGFNPFSWQTCPNLIYLGLECGSSVDAVEDFPDSLQELVLIFYETVNFEQLVWRVRALAKRYSLRSVTIVLKSWMAEVKLPVLMPLVFMELLQTLVGQGILTRYLVQRPWLEGLRVRGHRPRIQDHTNQTPLTDRLNDRSKDHTLWLA